MRGIKIKHLLLGIALIMLHREAEAQCPDVYDYLGNPSSSPEWYSCAGTDYTLNFQTNADVGNYTIDWNDGSPLEVGNSLLANAIIPHFYPLAVQTYTITFTDVDNGCTVVGTLVMEEATSASVQIPIGGVTQSCAPQAMEFTNTSTNVSTNTIFTWDFGDNSATESYNSSNLGQTISHVYNKGTVDCETVVTLTASNLCNIIQGGSSTATFDPIRIWDEDIAQITVDYTSICWPENTFNFTNSSVLNCQGAGNIGTRYEHWNFGDHWGQGQDSIIDWAVFPPPPTHTITFPAVGTYIIEMMDSNFCGVDTVFQTVEIVNPPVAGLTATPTTVCTGENINFTNSSTADANAYLVNYGDGTGWNGIVAGNFTHAYTNAGTYDIGLVSYVAGSINSCSDTAWVSITVEAGPIANFTLSEYSSCGPSIISITDNSTGASTWNWDFGNTSTSTSPTPGSQAYTTTGSYDITLLLGSPNGCQSTTTQTLQIFDPPAADFNFSATCDGDTVFFSNTSTSNPADPIVSYQWDFDDSFTSNIENPSHSFATAGNYHVTLTVNTANCSTSKTITVNIADGSSASFIPSILSGCSPLTIDLNNTSANADTYTWDLGDGNMSNATSPSQTYINTTDLPLDYVITLYTDNALGCKDTIQQVVTVNPVPQANFNMISGAPCSPIAVDFTNMSVGGDTYDWEFEPGMTSTLASPSYLFANATDSSITYSPTLIAMNLYGCTDTITQNITIYPEPNYTMDLSGLSGCSPLTVTMPDVVDATNYHWDFGNGNTSILANPTQIFVNLGTDTINYTVELVANNSFGCTDTTTSIITVYPSIKAQFIPSQVAGCSPLTVDFADASIGGNTYAWNFGDGATSTDSISTSHTFVNLGNAPQDFTITLDIVSAYGCVNTTDFTITVYPEVQTSFVSDTAGCTPVTIQYTNTSDGATSYYWSFGDGNIGIDMNPNHEYVNSGTTDLVLEAYLVGTSSYGCMDTTFKSITIYPEAIADFQTEVVQGCSPLDLTIQNDTVTGSTYYWIYGNGNNSTTNEAIHSEIFTNGTSDPLNYTIQLETTTEHGCIARKEQEIIVFPELEASFDVGTEFCANTDIVFTNTSSGATQYTWQFGDGNQGYDINPIYNYDNTSGYTQIFPVLLTAESTYGCTHSTFTLLNIFSAPVVDFNIDSTSVCYPLYLELSNNSQNGDTYLWTYGDGNTSTTDATTHDYTYTNDGQSLVTNTLELMVTTDHGCSASTSQEVQVIPELIADFEEIPDACHPLPVNFNNLSQGALEYQWTLDYDEITNEFEPSHTYVNYGIEDEIFNVSLVVSSYFGCTDTITRPIIVHPIPDAEFTVSPSLQTYPDATVEILDNSVYGTADYTWTISDGYSSDTTLSTYTFDTYGTYFIDLVIDNGYCSDEMTQRVDIIPPPPLSIFEGEGAGCTDLTVSFTNMSIFAEEYTWNFGDGSSSNEENPTHTYTVPGDYDVSLLVTGPGGNDMNIQEEIVHAYPHAVAAFTPTPSEAQTGDEVFFYNLSENASIYEWNFGNGMMSTEANPTLVYDLPGTYSITLIANNEYNCPDSLFMADGLEIEIGGYVNFPNAFTPSIIGPSDENYDPESLDNNVFHPTFAGVSKYNLQIYNRWGELLFETDDIDKGWNGYYQGNLVPMGVYVWRADVTFTDNKQIVESGDITLLR